MKLSAAIALAACAFAFGTASADESCDVSFGSSKFSFKSLPEGPRRVYLTPGKSDFLDVALFPCVSSSDMGFGCGGGYAAVLNKNSTCAKVFSKAREMRVDTLYQRFVERSFVTNDQSDNSSLTLRAHCDPSASESDFFANDTILSSFSNATGDTYLLQFYSRSVCTSAETTEEPMTTTPTPSDDGTVGDCDIVDGNETYTLKYLPTGVYEAPLRDNTSLKVALSACVLSESLGSGCKAAFVGLLNVNDTCEVTFSNVSSIALGGNFIERNYFSAGEVSELSLRVYCDPEADELFANSSHFAEHRTTPKDHYLISFYSKTVCANFVPSEDDEEDQNVLKTGTIVGIVIGVVGVVVLGAVIYQWRAKAEEEKSLQYSQLNN